MPNPTPGPEREERLPAHAVHTGTGRNHRTFMGVR